MELYLIRHGIAEEGGPGIQDEERALTEQGRQKTQRVAQRLYELGLRFDLILTSPLVRARQTAEILLSSGVSSQLEESPHLAPDGDMHNWLKQWLEPKPSMAHLALVGHQPDMGYWAETLVWGETRGVFVLKKAGIIGLTLPETSSPLGHSQLFLLTSPKFFIK